MKINATISLKVNQSKGWIRLVNKEKYLEANEAQETKQSKKNERSRLSRFDSIILSIDTINTSQTY